MDQITHVTNLMKENYNKAKICPYRGQTIDLNRYGTNKTSFHAYCDLMLEPDLNRIMEKSRNENELRYVWSEWREKVGPPVRNTFMRYLDLANQAAERHGEYYIITIIIVDRLMLLFVGFQDAGEQMRAVYEDPDFFFTVQDLWTKIQPLYKHLFTFVRRGLYKKYGDEVLRPDGPIPTHLFGNMWAQNWRSVIDLIKPYTETPDITGEMIKQGYTPTKIFQSAEEFFTSLGLPPMSPEFWRNSIIQKPSDIYTQCTASAWDFCNNVGMIKSSQIVGILKGHPKSFIFFFLLIFSLLLLLSSDFRIKQCTQVTLEDFTNAHHEMTHIQYYMQYSSQPFVYRESPNPAFHEVIS